jgi:hypothetical protein
MVTAVELCMLTKWFAKTAITPLERDLLDTIRDSAIPNPDRLREQLAALTRRIDATEREWERLDRHGNAEAFLALTPTAERLQALRAEAPPLLAAIESATRRRATFLALVRLFEAVAADVAARTQRLLEQPLRDSRERVEQLRELDHSTRIHVRLAARLAAISTSRQFRNPPDALRVLRDDLEARMRELERLRAPGMRLPLEWPIPMTELLDVVEDQERTTA